MLHLGRGAGELIGEDTVDRAVTLTESTSPNALLFASLDAARRQAVVHGHELLEHTMWTLAGARKRVRAIDGLDVLDGAIAGRPGVFDYDPLRLAVDVRGVAASGFELAPCCARSTTSTSSSTPRTCSSPSSAWASAGSTRPTGSCARSRRP